MRGQNKRIHPRERAILASTMMSARQGCHGTREVPYDARTMIICHTKIPQFVLGRLHIICWLCNHVVFRNNNQLIKELLHPIRLGSFFHSSCRMPTRNVALRARGLASTSASVALRGLPAVRKGRGTPM